MIDSRPILIAEDDLGMREGISRSLKREGYAVTLASDGKQALNQLQERAFRMVITDIEMPGAKGIDVLREVKKRTPEVPVVVITAYGSIGTAVEAMKEGAGIGTEPMRVPIPGSSLTLNYFARSY